AGLKPQLVHYYFRTMDDLFLEVFRRRADENVARVERALAADASLHALWHLNADPRGARFMIELVALANHRKAIRVEIARYAERDAAEVVDVEVAAADDEQVLQRAREQCGHEIGIDRGRELAALDADPHTRGDGIGARPEELLAKCRREIVVAKRLRQQVAE